VQQFAHLAFDFVGGADVSKRAATGARRIAQEVAVRRGADAHGEQSSGTQLLAKRKHELIFIAHRGIRDEDDLAQMFAGRGHRQRADQRGQHLGAAGCAQIAHVAIRFLEIIR
jgi:hypothetical protein